jgi:hypothetical protein
VGVPGVSNFISMGGPDHSYGRKKVANTGNEGGEKASRPSQPTQAATDSTKQTENAVRQGADQLRDQMTGMAGMSAKLSQDLIERSGQNFEMMKRIAETLASGVKSAVSESGEYAQNTARRQTEMMQQLTSARSPNDVLEIQNRYLQDSLRELLSFSERLSLLSADKAKEAGEHLDQNR